MKNDLINGREPEKVRFNISQCALGHCLSECPHESSDHCVEELLDDARLFIAVRESRIEQLEKVLKEMGVTVPEEDVK